MAAGEIVVKLGFNKDHWPDPKQMAVGVVLDEKGRPLCCEKCPGKTADVKTLVPVAKRVRDRFNVSKFCVLADRGMMSKEAIHEFEEPEARCRCIIGMCMRNVWEVKLDVLYRAENYEEVVPKGTRVKAPSPLKVEEVWVGNRRYVAYFNPNQARSDPAGLESILVSLEEQPKGRPQNSCRKQGLSALSRA